MNIARPPRSADFNDILTKGNYEHGESGLEAVREIIGAGELVAPKNHPALMIMPFVKVMNRWLIDWVQRHSYWGHSLLMAK